MSADDRNEGVSPLFAGLVDTILAEDNVVMQTRHYARRGVIGTACGASDGQRTDIPSATTCEACKAKAPKPRGRR